MFDFDGAILMDIMSMSGPPHGSTAADTVDGVDVYKFVRLGGPERDAETCEGCSKWGKEWPDLRFYASIHLHEDHVPEIGYCQECMDDLKRSYDEDPMSISAHGSIPGAPWWKPMFLSGNQNNVWKEIAA